MTTMGSCQEISELRVLPFCVHLIVRIDGDWGQDRDRMVTELERRIHAVEKYAHSSAFRRQFGARVPVLRVQSAGAAPSIVDYLMSEQGIEVEDTTESDSHGPSCVDCDRINLPANKAVMSARGWVCPCCDRARRRRLSGTARQLPSGLLSIPAPLLWPLLVVITVGFFVGVGVELSNLGQINQSVRAR
jgi:ABC-type anion transport system duplicated permease subunit